MLHTLCTSSLSRAQSLHDTRLKDGINHYCKQKGNVFLEIHLYTF